MILFQAIPFKLLYISILKRLTKIWTLVSSNLSLRMEDNGHRLTIVQISDSRIGKPFPLILADFLMYKMSNDVIEWNKEKRKQNIGIFKVQGSVKKVSNIAFTKKLSICWKEFLINYVKKANWKTNKMLFFFLINLTPTQIFTKFCFSLVQTTIFSINFTHKY